MADPSKNTSSREIFILIILVIIGIGLGWISTGGEKTQMIRLLDVFVYGPILIYASTQVSSWWLKILLILFGATTIGYNLHNYLVVQKSIEKS